MKAVPDPCQDLDHCIFIFRVIDLQYRILTTTMHQSSPSSITKSNSAKKQKKHYCTQTLIIYQTWVSNILIVKLFFYWKNVSCFIVDDKTVTLCEILLLHSFVLFYLLSFYNLLPLTSVKTNLQPKLQLLQLCCVFNL